MPEGPELHLASKYVNTSCRGRIFTGKVEKNPVHKSSDVDFECPAYTIAAASRGKEMQLILTKVAADEKKKVRSKGEDGKKYSAPESVKILFRFGMSGNFQFTTTDNIHKHSHLRFFTNDQPPMVLSYVDVRRFGRWEVGVDWSKDRGPDPMFEYIAFRSNVVSNLKKSAFDQPICETMLNQKYFNGIGNYLRAEILYRLKIAPFEKARTVLDGLPEEPPDVKPVKKGRGGGGNGKTGEAQPDLLHLCHTVPLEVIAIGAGGYTADGKASDYSDFMQWLQCYYHEGMNNMVDHNGRTIWFQGPAGPMAPKGGKSRTPKKRKQKKGEIDAESPAKVKKEESTEPENKDKKKGGKQKTSKAAVKDEETGSDSNKMPTSRKRASAKINDEKPTKNNKSKQMKIAETKEKPEEKGKGKRVGEKKQGKMTEETETKEGENGSEGRTKKRTRASTKKTLEISQGDSDRTRSTTRGKRKVGKK